MSLSAASGFSPSGELVAVRARAAALTDLLWSAQTDAELIGVVEEVQPLRSTLAALEAAAIVEVEARGIARTTLHYCSTGDWLTHIGGLRRGEGRRRVVRAQALAPDRARTRESLAEGFVSPEQAEVIVGAVESLPSGELVRARGERFMIGRAASLDASELARAGRHLAHVVDPTVRSAASRPSSPATNAPHMPTASSRSATTVPVGCASTDAASSRTERCSERPCSR